MEEEFELLRKYLRWRIDRVYVTTLEFKIANYAKTGFIEYGTPPNQLPKFCQDLCKNPTLRKIERIQIIK